MRAIDSARAAAWEEDERLRLEEQINLLLLASAADSYVARYPNDARSCDLKIAVERYEEIKERRRAHLKSVVMKFYDKADSVSQEGSNAV